MNDKTVETGGGSFWRRRVVAPISAQLRQGTTPEKLAITIAAGAMLGVFPIIGSSTLLCLAVAAAFRLNQPVIQLVNYLVYPLQIPLVFVFVRFGETLLGAPHVSFSIFQLMTEFRRDTVGFLATFGVTGLRGIFGWMVFATPFAFLMFSAMLPLLRRLSRAIVKVEA